MPAISKLAKSIACPRKFLFDIKNAQERYPEPARTSSRNRRESSEKITMGVIFESAIQHIMTNNRGQFQSDNELIVNWFKEVERNNRKISLHELNLPWDSSWITSQSVLGTKLSRSQWYQIRKAIKRWRNCDHPWTDDEVDWEREKEIEEDVNLYSNEEEYTLNLWGRIDLYGKGLETNYVVELKMTDPSSINQGRAQAALYARALEIAESEMKVKAYVFHSKKLIQSPFSDNDWRTLIESGIEDETNPLLFNCSDCRDIDCEKRFSGGA